MKVARPFALARTLVVEGLLIYLTFEMIHVVMWVILDATSPSASLLPGSMAPSQPTNESNPWGACMTELGCSSSSDLGFLASQTALEVSS